MPTTPTPSPAMWPYGRIKPGKNSREISVDDGIRELHQSIVKNGLLQPLLVTDQEMDNLMAGFRRHAALSLGGIETVSVLVYPASLTTTQRSIITATENLQRVDLADPEIYLSCTGLMAINTEWSRKDLAAHLCKDPSTITRWLCPDDLVPVAKQAFLDGKFGFAKAYSVVKSDDQLVALDLVLKGETRDGLERRNKKTRNGNSPAVRVSSIKIALADDISVVVKGEAIDLEQGIEALKDALKAMTKAQHTGLDAKTAQAVWRDTARAG